MRQFFGVIGIIAGLLLGLYMGLWVCFIGGLIDIVTEIADGINGTSPVSAMGIVWGIVKMCFAGLVGWVSVVVLWIPSTIALGGNVKVRTKRRR